MHQKISLDFNPFFLPSILGNLFSIYYPSVESDREKGVILYIHPFADEMNKSRRMAALQARELARSGYSVLQVDLFGCGDSEGDFSDATWAVWKTDIKTAVSWIKQRADTPIIFWGLRLGATLAVDVAADLQTVVNKFILWQPVVNGRMLINQFFRLASAASIVGKQGETAKELRQKLSNGKSVEIAGYELNPALVAQIENIEMKDFKLPFSSSIVLREIPLSGQNVSSIPVQKLIENFETDGCQIEAAILSGPAFWNTVEIAVLPELITSTIQSLRVFEL